MESVGYISAILLAICGIPTAFLSYSRKNSDHIDPYLLSLWFGGEITGLIYVIYLQNLPLMLNYITNCIILSVIVWFKLYPRREND